MTDAAITSPAPDVPVKIAAQVVAATPEASVWVSASADLLVDARRDLEAVCTAAAGVPPLHTYLIPLTQLPLGYLDASDGLTGDLGPLQGLSQLMDLCLSYY